MLQAPVTQTKGPGIYFLSRGSAGTRPRERIWICVCVLVYLGSGPRNGEGGECRRQELARCGQRQGTADLASTGEESPPLVEKAVSGDRFRPLCAHLGTAQAGGPGHS